MPNIKFTEDLNAYYLLCKTAIYNLQSTYSDSNINEWANNLVGSNVSMLCLG